jgi:methylated-DNA-protein-cysteine methyltransferase related protein
MSVIKNKVFEIVSAIPKGNVVSYGQIAKITSSELERLITAQMVGWMLSGMKETEYHICPWQRVVAKNGTIPTLKLGFKGNLQIQLLKEEGVTFDGENIIENANFLWDFDNYYFDKKHGTK